MPPRSTTPTWTTTLASNFLNEMMANAPLHARAEIAEQRAEYMNKENDQEPAERTADEEDAESTEYMERETEVQDEGEMSVERAEEETAGKKRKKIKKSKNRPNHGQRGSARARGDDGRARGT